jgi:hypothetical protein
LAPQLANTPKACTKKDTSPRLNGCLLNCLSRRRDSELCV